jgi:hypothetical protein
MGRYRINGASVIYWNTSCHITSYIEYSFNKARLKESEGRRGQGLKLCKRCFREFDEGEGVEYSPARQIGDIFISAVGEDDVEDLCPECREGLGIMNIIGFRRHSLC